MKNLYTYEDIANDVVSDEQQLEEIEQTLQELDSESDGSTNDGYDTLDDAMIAINTPELSYTPETANSFFGMTK